MKEKRFTTKNIPKNIRKNAAKMFEASLADRAVAEDDNYEAPEEQQNVLNPVNERAIAALKDAEAEVLRQLNISYRALEMLSQARVASKMSVSRVTGVARELKELIKVMSVYA